MHGPGKQESVLFTFFKGLEERQEQSKCSLSTRLPHRYMDTGNHTGEVPTLTKNLVSPRHCERDLVNVIQVRAPNHPLS